MSGFSQNITSPLPDANVLFDPVKAIQGAQAIQSNQLANQGNQMKLDMAGADQVRQAAAGILSSSNDEGVRAQLYPRVVGLLQSQGLAKSAPAQYPGEATLRALVNSGLSAKDLYASGALLTPQQQQAFGSGSAGGGGGLGGGGQPGVTVPPMGGGGPGASATVPPEYMPYFQEASQKTGIPVDLLIAQARQESGFRADAKGAAGEIGLFQIKPSTASDPGGGVQGVDPATLAGPGNVRNNILFGAQYLKSRMQGDPANPAVQVAGLRAYNGGGDPNYVQNVFRYRPAPAQPAATTASAAPACGPKCHAGAAQARPRLIRWRLPAQAPLQEPRWQHHWQRHSLQAPAPGDEFDVPQAAGGPHSLQPLRLCQRLRHAASASTSNLPEVSTIPSGYQSPGYQHGWALYSQGRRELQAAGSNPSFAQQAQADMAEGQRLMSLGSVVSAQQAGRPGEYDTITGKFTPWPFSSSLRRAEVRRPTHKAAPG